VRTLPNKVRRMVGAWCFVDHFGAAGDPDIGYGGGHDMRVPPHPHTGLQTVTWLVEGSVRHRDSLGSDQLISPGQLNLMTAGRGIAHAETTPAGVTGTLHGVQLWVALPDAGRDGDPDFAHHADLPVLDEGGVAVRVLLGELDAARSPARAYTPIVGAEITLDAGARTRLDLEPAFEYAAIALTGTVDVDTVGLAPGPMLYLGCGRSDLALASAGGGRILLLGGEPFEERIVMWWNFIGRSHDEVEGFRSDWEAGRRFGPVSYEGDRLPAPPMPVTALLPRGRVRE
jgi:hypothetical protein